jgi:hypothetical protein
MKKLIPVALLLFGFQQAQAQFSVGPKIGFGAGSFSSGNLKHIVAAEKFTDNDVNDWSVRNRPGFYYSLGIFAQYSFNDRFALLTDISYNGLSSAIKTYHEENKVDASGKGDISIIDSRAGLKTSFFSVPLLAKYTLGGERGIYLTGGLRFNFMRDTYITSEELKTKTQYVNGAIDKQTIEPRNVSALIDVTASTRTSFVLGAGTTLNVMNKDLMLDLRYNLPLTRSAMYTHSARFDDVATKNNEFFGHDGKLEAETDNPNFKLNDFKMGILELTLSYPLFKN